MSGGDNISDATQPDDQEYDYTPLGLDAFVLVLVIGVGVCGNLLTILSVTHYKQLKSATNFLVVNIGLADIMVCAYSVSTILANRIGNGNVFHDIICHVNAFALFSAAGVSNFSFTLIAIARNLCVFRRSVYQRHFTDARVIAYCCSCWLFWFAVSGIFWWQKGFGYIPEAFICFYYDNESSFALSFLLTLLGVAAPSLIAASCYISLFVKLFLIRREADASLRETTTSVSKEWRALAPVLTAFIVFNLCWGPYSIHVYIDRFVFPVGRMAHKVITWLAVFNSTLNPIIYGLLNPQFRRSYSQLAKLALCAFGRSPTVRPLTVDRHGELNSERQP